MVGALPFAPEPPFALPGLPDLLALVAVLGFEAAVGVWLGVLATVDLPLAVVRGWEELADLGGALRATRAVGLAAPTARLREPCWRFGGADWITVTVRLMTSVRTRTSDRAGLAVSSGLLGG